MVNNYDEIEPDSYKRWHYWVHLKEVHIWVRTNLSRVLAWTLAVLVVLSDGRTLRTAATSLTPSQWMLCILLLTTLVFGWWFRLMYVIRQGAGKWRTRVLLAIVAAASFLIVHDGEGLWGKVKVAGWKEALEWLVLVTTIGTFLAAFWEMFGEKLPSADEREARFALQVGLLLRALDDFYAPSHGGTTESPRAVLEKFTTQLVEATCFALCGKTTVSGAFMTPDEGFLRMSIISKDAHYDPLLAIPLRSEEEGPGPAAYAHKKSASSRCVYYLPYKETKEVWPIGLPTEGTKVFRFPPPVEAGWVPAQDPSFEDFCSVLCVPVRFYLGKGRSVEAGVLTVSTKRSDPFLTRDFIMAKSFARILGQAMAIAANLDNPA